MIPLAQYLLKNPTVKKIDAILENESKDEILFALAQQGRGFYVPSLYDVSYNDDGTVKRSRPLCPYPQEARYSGQGDVNDAKNFSCAK